MRTKKLRERDDSKIMTLLEKNLKSYGLFTKKQLDFIFKRNETLAIETIDDFYISTTFLEDVVDVDLEKMTILLKEELKIGSENVFIEFYKFYFYKKLDNLKQEKKLEFLKKSEKNMNEKSDVLKKFINEFKIYFLLRFWENESLPISIGDLNLEQLLLLVSRFKNYKKDELNDRIMALLFKKASMWTQSIFHFSMISNFQAGQETKLAIKKKISSWLLDNKDKYDDFDSLKKFIKKWKIEFKDDIKMILNKKR